MKQVTLVPQVVVCHFHYFQIVFALHFLEEMKIIHLGKNALKICLYFENQSSRLEAKQHPICKEGRAGSQCQNNRFWSGQRSGGQCGHSHHHMRHP